MLERCDSVKMPVRTMNTEFAGNKIAREVPSLTENLAEALCCNCGVTKY